jgi:hypothetical protein
LIFHIKFFRKNYSICWVIIVDISFQFRTTIFYVLYRGFLFYKLLRQNSYCIVVVSFIGEGTRSIYFSIEFWSCFQCDMFFSFYYSAIRYSHDSLIAKMYWPVITSWFFLYQTFEKKICYMFSNLSRFFISNVSDKFLLSV